MEELNTVTLEFESMAVDVSCAFHDVPAAQIAAARTLLRCARRDVERWAGAFTRFDAVSELMQLNAARSAIVHEELFSVIEQAITARAMTNGLFDPTMGAEIRAHGYDRTFDALTVPGDRAIAAGIDAVASTTCRSGRSGGVQLDRAALRVTLGSGVELDLGGIAKGWMADRLMSMYAGTHPMLVSVGGDIACSARTDGAPWLIDVEHHVDGRERSVRSLEIEWGGVATSGIHRHRWIDGNGTERHHLIDPATRDTARTTWSVVTVVAASSAVAEGFATAATMATGTQLAAWAQDHELVIIATDEDGVSRVFEGQDETAHRAD